MIETLILLSVFAASSTESLEKDGPMAGIYALVGAAITGAVSYLLARQKSKSSLESTAQEAEISEIDKLRSVTWDHFRDLQSQISQIKAELETEKEYTDALREHIFMGFPPPPPKRRKPSNDSEDKTGPIDLTE